MNRLALSLSVLVVAALTAVPALADTTTTFNFTGDCLDCSNPQGQLVLQNYVPGDALNDSNLVSFTYTSNLANVSITQSDLAASYGLWGVLGSTRGSYTFETNFYQGGQTYEFYTLTDGEWCYGPQGTCDSFAGGIIGIDHGTNGVFSPAVPANTPEPSSLLLLGTTLLAAAAALHRKLIA